MGLLQLSGMEKFQHFPSYDCDECNLVFRDSRQLRSHQRTHSLHLLTCFACDKTFINQHNLVAHQRIHAPRTCGVPRNTLLQDYQNFRATLRLDQCNPPAPQCDVAVNPPPPAIPVTRENLAEQIGGAFQHGDEDLENRDNHDDIDVILRRHRGAINSYYRIGKVLDIANVEVDQGIEDVRPHVEQAYIDHIQTHIKVNASCGFVLKRRVDNKLRYYHSSVNNSSLFNQPRLVSSYEELRQFVEDCLQVDLLEWIRQRRPNTSWVVHRLTNVTFYFYKITGTGRIGHSAPLPQCLVKSRTVLALTTNTQTGQPYTDNLCFFRALSILVMCKCRGKCKCKKVSENKTKALYLRWADHRRIDSHPSDFKGVTVEDLLQLEKFYHVSIIVYTLKGDGIGTCFWKSTSTNQKKLNLCLHDNHFSLIKDVSNFVASFLCKRCGCTFTKATSANRHGCKADEDRLKFPTGTYRPKETIFDTLLQRFNIDVDFRDRIYPYRITYDIESMMERVNMPSNTNKLEFISRHKLMSISVCSNVPGYLTPQCFISKGQPEEVIERFVTYIESIQDKSFSLMKDQFAQELEQLDEEITSQIATEMKFKHHGFSNPSIYHSRSPVAVKDKFMQHLAVIPIVGFNSGSYDLNVMKGPLLKFFHDRGKINYVIKRASRLQCIQTDRFKFLDMMNYLTPGTSYARYLKAFDVTSSKGFFPYEYITDLGKLTEETLPPHKEFYSSLTQSNISNEDYEFCQRVWKEHKMKTMEDFLRWYNNLDVEPFLEAIQKQMDIYRSRRIDMLKDCISIPGVAVKWKFDCLTDVNIDIPLISKSNADLYHTVKKNIVGGPSIVFHRYHESKVTKIRQRMYGDEANSCGEIVGFDANALYLWSMMQEMPTGSPIRRQTSNNFQPMFTDKYGRTAWTWMEFLADRDNIRIEHKFNSGEVRLGQHGLPVDGFCRTNNTVYQFHGCVHHGHRCRLTRNRDYHPMSKVPFDDLAKDTKLKEEYIKALGFKLITITECAWLSLLDGNKQISSFVSFLHSRSMSERKPMTEAEIISSMMDDKWFGLIECDICVPDHLKEKFSEMAPIFKNVSIGRSHLNDHMRQFSEENDCLRQPQRMLIGSLFGDKILLSSPLAKWYIQHGLKITKIYQIIQYKPERCFEAFGESVSNSRREGDVDPSKSLLAETSKLVGRLILNFVKIIKSQ